MENRKDRESITIQGEGTIIKPFEALWGNDIRDFAKQLAEKEGGTVRKGNSIYVKFNENLFFIRGRPTEPNLGERVFVDLIFPERAAADAFSVRTAVFHAIHLYSAFLLQ